MAAKSGQHICARPASDCLPTFGLRLRNARADAISVFHPYFSQPANECTIRWGRASIRSHSLGAANGLAEWAAETMAEASWLAALAKFQGRPRLESMLFSFVRLGSLGWLACARATAAQVGAREKKGRPNAKGRARFGFSGSGGGSGGGGTLGKVLHKSSSSISLPPDSLSSASALAGGRVHLYLNLAGGAEAEAEAEAAGLSGRIMLSLSRSARGAEDGSDFARERNFTFSTAAAARLDPRRPYLLLAPHPSASEEQNAWARLAAARTWQR